MEEGQSRRRVLSRRRFLQGAVAAAGAAAAASVLPTLSAEAWSGGDWLRRWTLPSDAYRAVLSYQAQQAHFYRARCVPGDTTSLYLEAAGPPAEQPNAFVWPFSQAAAATLDLLGLPPGYGDYRAAVHDRLYLGLPRYWDGASYAPCAGPGHANAGVWYDDNAWVGLDLVRAYRLTGDHLALQRAIEVFDFITTGWHVDNNEHAPGGLYWVHGTTNRHRNTCSNGPSAELSLRLYQITGEASYLAWGKKLYAWVNETLRAKDGLYWDHIDVDGSIDRSVHSYNQGTMAGAGALLHQITGDPTYLERAKETAAAALTYHARDGFLGQPPAFVAIFFRNLLHLATVDDTHLLATLRAMHKYADDCWLTRRNADGLFPYPPEAAVAQLLHQAGMIQIYACLAWEPARYDLLV